MGIKTIIAILLLAPLCLHGQTLSNLSVGVVSSDPLLRIYSEHGAALPDSVPAGAVDWDGLDDYVDLNADLNADIEGTKIIKFNTLLESDVSTGFVFLFALKSTSTNDYLAVSYSPGQHYLATRVDQSGGGGGHQHTMTAYHDQVVAVEIRKTAGQIDYLKIEGVTTAETGTLTLTAPDDSFIGANAFGGGTQNHFNYGYFWDLQVYDSDGTTLLHHWKGYPDGDQDSGWTDQEGSIDGTVYGSPSTR